MNSYLFYLAIASLTIASPGPGVVLTLTTSLKFGLVKTFPAIMGVSLGMFIIAVLSATGLGLLIATNADVYNILKVLGAFYLLYLSTKLFLSMKKNYQFEVKEIKYSAKKLFFEGFVITIANPKPLIFFIALFPQFIDQSNFMFDFLRYSLSFCVLIMIIHSAYGSIAQIIRQQSSNNYFRYVNFMGGVAYMIFALVLISSEISH